MTINNKYFDIVIDNDKFYIDNSSLKPSSAIKTLTAIESIVNNPDRFIYDASRQDAYHNLSKEELFQKLKEISLKIQDNYKKTKSEKQSILPVFENVFFGDEKKISQICTRIDNRVNPPIALPLPAEIIAEIAQHVETPVLGTLRQLNRVGKAQMEDVVVRRAKGFGYEGDNEAEAIKYLNCLMREVHSLVKQEIIPSKLITYKGKTFSAERVLENLQSLTAEEIFTLLSNEKLYLPAFTTFRKFFRCSLNWKLTSSHSENEKQKGKEALLLAVKHAEKSIMELLLQHGVDPNCVNCDGEAALHLAAQAGSLEIVELLLKTKANVDLQTGANATALLYACGYNKKPSCQPNVELIALLLKHNANPNLAEICRSHTALHLAAKVGCPETVKLLLEFNAEVDHRDKYGTTALAYACYSHREGNKSSTKAVELLLRKGADPHSPYWTGSVLLSPLDYAEIAGYKDILVLLNAYSSERP